MKKTPGQRMREWRQSKSLTQDAAAALVGITQNAWSLYERDATIPGLDPALKIRKVVGIEVEAWT